MMVMILTSVFLLCSGTGQDEIIEVDQTRFNFKSRVQFWFLKRTYFMPETPYIAEHMPHYNLNSGMMWFMTWIPTLVQPEKITSL